MPINDKVLHFLVSCATTIVIYFISRYLLRGRRVRLSFAGIATFLLGLLKELGDGWLWEWPWCPCRSEVYDLLANLIGIVVAILGIIHGGFILEALRKKPSEQQLPVVTTTAPNNNDEMTTSDAAA